MDLSKLLLGFVGVVLSAWCLKKSKFNGIEHLQIGNLPAMGSLSLNVVFGRFLQRLGTIKRSQVMFMGGKTPHHQIFVLVLF